MIDRQVQHLTRLVDDLLDVSRISRNKLELRKDRVDLAGILTAAVEASLPLIEKNDQRLTVKVPPQPIYLAADRIRLAQVFTNLLNNSAKFTPRGGEITLSAFIEDKHVSIRVVDNGIGIAPEQLPHISELFYQLDTSLEKSQGGLGVGLTLVWQLVAMHGGRVDARSEGLGKGSEFEVHLPTLVEGSPKPSIESPSEAATGSGLRVLVADDNVDSADGLALFLTLDGHSVQTAYDGVEALQAAEKFRPDVILLDIGMPQMNGYAVAERIRERPWGKNVMLIAQTGWGQQEDVDRSRQAGFDFHLTKPTNFDALRKLLSGVQIP